MGTGDAVLVSSHPAVPEPPAPPVAHRAQPTDAALPGRSLDDTDLGWGDAPDVNDDRLRRDKPPHW